MKRPCHFRHIAGSSGIVHNLIMKVLSGESTLKLVFVSMFVLTLLQGCGGIRSFSAKENLLISSNINPEEKIKLSSSEPAITNSQAIAVTFEFDSAVKLKESDVVVSGGIIQKCTTGTSSSFTCTLIPKSKAVSVQIVSGTIRNSDGSDAGSSNVLSFVVNSADKVYGLCIKKSEYEEKFGSLRW